MVWMIGKKRHSKYVWWIYKHITRLAEREVTLGFFPKVIFRTKDERAQGSKRLAW